MVIKLENWYLYRHIQVPSTFLLDFYNFVNCMLARIIQIIVFDETWSLSARDNQIPAVHAAVSGS